MLALTLLLPSLTLASPVPRSQPILLNTTYVSPIFLQSRSTITSLSLASIHHLASSAGLQNKTSWKAQNAWTTIAQWDFQHNTTTFEERFREAQMYDSMHQSGCFGYWGVPLVDCFNDDAVWGALASLEGAGAYGRGGYEGRAVEVWEFVTDHGFINETVLEEGYLKGSHYENNTLEKTCEGKGMYGGVYWQNGIPTMPDNKAAADPQIDSGSTVGYALLSAKLCRITNDTSYCDRAYDAMQFFDRFFLDPETGFARGHIDGNNCSQPTDYLITTITGNYIATYTLLGNTTSNSTMLSIARRTALNAMTSNVWNTPQGVLFEATAKDSPGRRSVVGLMGVLIRRLHLIYAFMDEDMQAAIRQYVNIQYWSLVNRDSDDAEKPLVFGKDWTGPYAAPKSAEDAVTWQFQAVDVINAVLALNPDSAFPDDDSTDCPVVGLQS